MLARSASNNRVAASAIRTSSVSISLVCCQSCVMSRIVCSRSMRSAALLLPLDDGQRIGQSSGDRADNAAAEQLPRTSNTYSGSVDRAAIAARSDKRRRQPASAATRLVALQRFRRQFDRHGRLRDAANGNDRPVRQRRLRTTAAASALVAVRTRSSAGSSKSVDVGNLAGQVEQVRYDVWHWRVGVGQMPTNKRAA